MKTEIDKNGNITKIPEQPDWDYFHKVIKPEYDKKGMEVPPHLEPDFMEGWK